MPSDATIPATASAPATYAAEYERLYKLGRFCFSVLEPFLPEIPRDRQGQRFAVEHMIKLISLSGLSCAISKGFLIDVLRCPDQDLIGGWTGSASDIAWLMTHESLSNFFPKFAIDYLRVAPYLIHHVPKTAGTSVNLLAFQNGHFIAYPQTMFETMCASSGVAGFAIQLAEFETVASRDRIYLGGHYNLPDMVDWLGIMGRCKGVTLGRPPLAVVSSALRFIWTQIENGDASEMARHPQLEPAHLTALRESLTGFEVPWEEIDKAVKIIVDLPEFRANYDEIFTKYFYSDQISDPASLQQFLRDCGDLFPCVEIEKDKDLVLQQLDIEGTLPRENTSLLSHKDLVRAVGGETQFRALVAPKMEESVKIYDVLCKMRNQYRK